MVVKSLSSPVETMAEWHEKLGYVPLSRIRFNPPPGTATEADVIRFLESDDKRIYELIDGTLVEKAMGMRESVLAGVLIRLIGNFVDEHELGIMAGSDGPYRMLRGNIRYPDVSFVPWSAISGDDIPKEKIYSIPPALAIEVLSESNTQREIDRKINELFRMGCQLIWIIDPELKEAVVYTSPNRNKRVGENGVLSGGRVLPGFQLSLRKLFSSTRKPGTKSR